MTNYKEIFPARSISFPLNKSKYGATDFEKLVLKKFSTVCFFYQPVTIIDLSNPSKMQLWILASGKEFTGASLY